MSGGNGDTTATTPGELSPMFIRAINAGDVETLVELYEPDALYLMPDGTEIRGRAAIREMLSDMVGAGARWEATPRTIVEAGELALVTSSWTIHGTDADGTPVTLSGTSNEVCRRRPDGSWRLLIDATAP